eukprot:scaffold1041_cov124-Isochrysis_galbana.AAC.6
MNLKNVGGRGPPRPPRKVGHPHAPHPTSPRARQRLEKGVILVSHHCAAAAPSRCPVQLHVPGGVARSIPAGGRASRAQESPHTAYGSAARCWVVV